ncbi:MAG: hypothetical protein Q4C03_08175 [bacterium]|nr:hypothetical protein [bacterium]
MKKQLFRAIYNGFFRPLANTPTKKKRFKRWTKVMVEWSTTTLSETMILRHCGFQVKSHSNRLKKIRQVCAYVNPKLFERCKRLRQNLKSKSIVLTDKIESFADTFQTIEKDLF